MCISFRSGQVVAGKHRISSRIGEGGFGAVYRAFDTELSRDVALKISSVKLTFPASDEEALRFKREARILAQLIHPNIVKVYAVNIIEDGIPLIAMEYLEGKTLSRLLKEQKSCLGYEQCRNLLRQICTALSYAHGAGVVHRDLTPANIFLVGNNSSAVKLIDFGLARLFGSNSPATAKLTKTGVLMGNPVYMSPEACRGELCDLQSDIYSLGCSLCEMLTGSPPFSADSAVGLLYKHQHDYPDEPELSWGLTAEEEKFKYIALKCLQKDKSRRFKSADEILEVLEGSLVPSPLAELDRWKGYRKPGSASRSGLLYMLAGIALLLALGTAGCYWFWTMRKQSMSHLQTVQTSSQVSNATDREREIRRLIRLLDTESSGEQSLDALMGIAAVYKKEGKIDQAINLNKQVLAAVQKKKSYSAQATCLLNLTDLYCERHDFDKARQAASSLCALDPKLLSPSQFREMVGILEERNLYNQTERICKHALAETERINEPDSTDVYEKLMALGDVYLLQQQLPPAYRTYSRALNIATRRGIVGLTAESASALALVCFLQNNYGEAEQLCRRVLQLCDTVDDTAKAQSKMNYWDRGGYKKYADLVAHKPDACNARAVLEMTLRRQGKIRQADQIMARIKQTANREVAIDYSLRRFFWPEAVVERSISQKDFQKAENLIRQAISFTEEFAGPSSPVIMDLYTKLSDCLIAQKKHSEAVAVFDNALVKCEQIHGTDSAETCEMLWWVTNSHNNLREFSKAATFCKRGLALTEKLGGNNFEQSKANWLQMMGDLNRNLGKFAEAESCSNSSLTIRQRKDGSNSLPVSSSLSSLGATYFVQHRYREAETCWRQALSIAEKSASPDTRIVLYKIVDLAQVASELENYSEAEALAGRSLFLSKKVLNVGSIDELRIRAKLSLIYARAHNKEQALALAISTLSVPDAACDYQCQCWLAGTVTILRREGKNKESEEIASLLRRHKN